jgi:hypothetical protein
VNPPPINTIHPDKMKHRTIRKIPFEIAATVTRYPSEPEAHRAIITRIEQFWLRKDITLVPVENDSMMWHVQLGERIHPDARVVRQGVSYHFAFINTIPPHQQHTL